MRSGKARPEGPCHLCGVHGPLSFEHTPPRSAFNERPLWVQTGEDYFGGQPGSVSQRGAGGYSLCGRCNEKTGGWYGRAFVEWSYCGAETLGRIGEGQERLGDPLRDRGQAVFVQVEISNVYPLRIIKEVIVMMMATCGPAFREKQPYLEPFVLDRRRKGLPSKYRVFAFLYGGGGPRVTGVVDDLDVKTGKSTLLAEVAYPPLGYVLTLAGEMHDRRPAEITHFANYEYDERRAVTLRLPTLPTHWIMPGDYRTKSEMERDRLINLLDAAGVRESGEVVYKIERARGS